MKETVVRNKIYLIYFVLYSAFGAFFPFLSMHLKANGMNFTQIGIILALNSILSVIVQPVWGYITDKFLGKRKTLVFTLVSCVIFVVIISFTKNFYLSLLSILVFTAVQCPIGTIVDAYCYEVADTNKKLQYGKARLMGSIGYAVTSLAIGYVIKNIYPNSGFFFSSIMFIVTIFVVKNVEYKGKASNKSINLRDVKTIVKNKNFMLLTISSMLICSCVSANGNYIPMLIQKTGGDIGNLGVLWFIVAISEIPVLFYGSKLLKKYGVFNLYMFSMVMYVIRYFLDSISPSYQFVLAIQVLQAVTYTLFLMSSLKYIQDTVDEKMRTTAFTVFTAISGGIGGFIGNYMGGVILQKFNVIIMFRTITITAAIALVIAIVLRNSFQKEKQITLTKIDN